MSRSRAHQLWSVSFRRLRSFPLPFSYTAELPPLPRDHPSPRCPPTCVDCVLTLTYSPFFWGWLYRGRTAEEGSASSLREPNPKLLSQQPRQSLLLHPFTNLNHPPKSPLLPHPHPVYHINNTLLSKKTLDISQTIITHQDQGAITMITSPRCHQSQHHDAPSNGSNSTLIKQHLNFLHLRTVARGLLRPMGMGEGIPIP